MPATTFLYDEGLSFQVSHHVFSPTKINHPKTDISMIGKSVLRLESVSTGNMLLQQQLHKLQTSCPQTLEALAHSYLTLTPLRSVTSSLQLVNPTKKITDMKTRAT